MGNPYGQGGYYQPSGFGQTSAPTDVQSYAAPMSYGGGEWGDGDVRGVPGRNLPPRDVPAPPPAAPGPDMSRNYTQPWSPRREWESSPAVGGFLGGVDPTSMIPQPYHKEKTPSWMQNPMFVPDLGSPGPWSLGGGTAKDFENMIREYSVFNRPGDEFAKTSIGGISPSEAGGFRDFVGNIQGINMPVYGRKLSTLYDPNSFAGQLMGLRNMQATINPIGAGVESFREQAGGAPGAEQGAKTLQANYDLAQNYLNQAYGDLYQKARQAGEFGRV